MNITVNGKGGWVFDMNTTNKDQQIKPTDKEAQELIQSSLIERIEGIFNAL